MVDRLDLCLMDVVLEMKDVNVLLEMSAKEVRQDYTVLREKMDQLRKAKKVVALQKLLPVGSFIASHYLGVGLRPSRKCFL